MMVTSVVWSVSNALEMMGLDLGTKLFWANVQYICYNIIPVTWMLLALEYTGKGRWLTLRRLPPFLVIPILTIIFAWTNDWHGLMRRDIFLDTSGAFPVVGKTYGPWFWIYAAYAYPLMTVSIVIHVIAVLRTPRLYRWQAAALVIGLVLPLVVNLSYTFKLSPFNHDVAPIALSIGGVLYALALFRFRLFDLVPAGYHLVINSMGDGMIIVDKLGRIVDLNPAAERITGVSADMIGEPAAKALGGRFVLDRLLQAESGYAELSPQETDQTGYYVARWWPVTDDRGSLRGRVLLLHDITEAKEAQQEVVRQQRLTAVLRERERLARELHDSVGQVLGYVNVQTQTVMKLIADRSLDRAQGCLRKLIGAVRESHISIREFIQSTMSPVLVDVGLFPAIQDLLERFGKNHGFRTQFADNRTNLNESLSAAVEAQVLRIVQEALSNIRKHAEAKNISISVSDTHDEVQLTVRDDGKGFDPEAVDEAESFGLKIMRERAAEAGCTVKVVSSPGCGTEVRLNIPFSLRDRAGESGDRKENRDDAAESSGKMRVLLVDDHPLFLGGLVDLLTTRGIEVVGTAQDGYEAVQQAQRLAPSVVVMDVQMPLCDGLTATRLIKTKMPETKVIMLTMVEDDEALFQAIKNGASGYLLKDLSGEEFVDMLRGLERGEVPVSPGIASRFLREFTGEVQEDVAATSEMRRIREELSARQIEVLTLVAKGLTYRQIGEALSLGERTIKYHMGQIIAKLHVKNRRQAIELARRSGL
jgi:signal transduction histidine kinase/DNA-binding NarL/FixJ family response regulator